MIFLVLHNIGAQVTGLNWTPPAGFVMAIFFYVHGKHHPSALGELHHKLKSVCVNIFDSL